MFSEEKLIPTAFVTGIKVKERIRQVRRKVLKLCWATQGRNVDRQGDTTVGSMENFVENRLILTPD